MATRGSIGKIALDAILEPATIPLVTPQQAVKLSRGLFKDMIKKLGGINQMYRNPLKPRHSQTNPENFKRWSPNYGKQTEERFSAIENILKKRTADPTPLISDAVSTGKINGKKLSSQERNELAARLQVLNAYKTGDMPYIRNNFNANVSSVSNPSEQFYMSPWDIMDTPEILKRDAIRGAYRVLEQKAPRGSALDKMADAGYTRNLPPENPNILDTPLTNSRYDIEDIIDKEVFGHKGTYGRGYMNRYSNRDINKSLQIPILYNNIIKKYDITDKKVGETIYSLLPEWTGSIDDLVNIARMLNP